MIDLTVTNIAERIYDLQREVEAEPVADDVSRGDWFAVRLAVRDLYTLVCEKTELHPLQATPRPLNEAIAERSS